MVKVQIRGGVWKNSEDEILKAAVQKYGKQQWGRVASLLNKKTAKQAKARWHEWLDPSIRKTEWSREEEEKLLHLAKLMPAQWKTIAPIVGRTATQCQEHYEYMLDQTAGGGDAADDLRKQALKPGQIDAHPETRPARPDPIDMDDDELEMLQEARARLANTQGKKAKRKAREKMLAQAKRLAELQKRRELKQAGLLSKAAAKKSKKNKKEIDLGVEIPFHKPAPAGIHDTTGEASRSEVMRQKRLKDVDYHKVNENVQRSRDREVAQAKKREEHRLKILEQSNDKYMKQQHRVDETPARPRGSLNLPAPTMTDMDLEQISKIQRAQQHSMDTDGNAATQALLGDYTDRPLPTPMRSETAQRDLKREAVELRRLEQGRTPLLQGGDDDEEEVVEDVAPSSVAADRATVGRTPGSVATRDHFGLNRPTDDDGASVGASTFASSKYSIRDMARRERRAVKRARQDLEAALAALPAPQFEYELAAPELDDEMDDRMQVETVGEEDRAEVEEREREHKRLKTQKLYEARSTVVKRSLPRPNKRDASSMDASTDGVSAMIQREMVAMMDHDRTAFPIAAFDPFDGKKLKKKTGTGPVVVAKPLEKFTEEDLASARELLMTEAGRIEAERIAEVIAAGKATNDTDARLVLTEEIVKGSQDGAAAFMWTPADGWTARTDASELASLRAEFSALQEALSMFKTKNEKQIKKLGVVTCGYKRRADKVAEEVLASFSEWNNAKIEEGVYTLLRQNEEQGAANRIDMLKEEIVVLKGLEATLQQEYGDLLLKRRRLVVQAKEQRKS